jgi:hypothetical protein
MIYAQTLIFTHFGFLYSHWGVWTFHKATTFGGFAKLSSLLRCDALSLTK